MQEWITKKDLGALRVSLLRDIAKLIDKTAPGESEPSETPQWIRSKVVRQLLIISPATLQNLRITGKIAFKKVLGSYYYKRADVLGLFEQVD